MSNFINDRIKLFREKTPTEFLLKPDGSLNTCEEWYTNVEIFLKTSLESLIEDIENGLPEYRIANYEENNYEAGYNEALSQIQTLLKSYKQSL